MIESLYRTLSLIRAVEEKIIEVYPSDVIQQPVHLSIGQEAIAAAVCANLTSEDRKIGTHRSHALYLANGGDPVGLFAELLGKPQGCSGGRGGSMHLCDPDRGLLGTTSIVGGCLPIACGMAEAIEPPSIVVCFFGDGACDEGVFAESLNWAALRNLRILFVLENNRLAVETPLEDRRRGHIFQVVHDLGLTANHFGLPAPGLEKSEVHGMAILLSAIIGRIRKNSEPEFLGCDVIRAYSHNGIEKQRELGEYDPIEITRSDLPARVWQRIDGEVNEQVEGAWKEARDA